MNIRKIELRDNFEIAKVIKKTLEEFKIARPGTVYTDPTTDSLFELFETEGSVYFIAEDQGKILGGCGIFPTEGLPKTWAELVKFYVDKNARGKGVGRDLLLQCFQWAKENGYKQLYLETLPELNKAVGIYEKAGFTKLKSPLGNSGHFSCTVWMMKEF